MPARNLHDTRLLVNLLKTEKDAQQSFKKWTKDTTSASAALSAWSVADSGDTQDLMKAYINALSAYRASLKDVLDRENSLRTVVRDREILVGRLIKLGNKKPSDSGVDKHQQQLDDAHRELAACETFLQEEEILLAESKRRSFRDSLAFRMRAMADLGRTMEDSAAEAIELLSRLGQGEFDGEDYDLDHEQDDAKSEGGDSMTPSQSASQAMSRSSSSSSLLDEIDNPITGASSNPRALSPTTGAPLVTGRSRAPRALSPARSPRALSPSREGSRATSPVPRVASPTPRQSSTNGIATAPTSIIPRAATLPRAAPTPRPNLGPVPTAPRPLSAYTAVNDGSTMPSFEIPKAPTNVTTRGPNDDSSDEEMNREFQSHVNDQQQQNRNSRSVTGGGHHTLQRQSFATRPRADSDVSSTGRGSGVGGGGGRKRRGSFFGGLASLFKKKDKRSATADDDSDYGVRLKRGGGFSSSGVGSKWETRTDRNVFAAHHLGTGGGSGGGRNILGRSRDNDSSSDDEAMPRNVVRVVNDPKARSKAMSDVGRSLSPTPSISGGTTTKKKKKTKVPEKAMSDIGVRARSAVIPQSPPPKTKRMSSSASVPQAVGMMSSSLAPPVPAIPSNVNNTKVSGTATPSETGSVKKKKKKKTVREQPETIVLSAEKLGIPTSGTGTGSGGLKVPESTTTPSRQKLSRSNTVTSTTTVGTNATGTKKKKKKRAVDGETLGGTSIVPNSSSLLPPPPSAADLASSLPSAKPKFDPMTTTLPLPSDEPNLIPVPTSAGLSRSNSTAGHQHHHDTTSMPSASLPEIDSTTTAGTGVAGKAPKSLADGQKRAKRDSALLGTNDWISHPTGTTSATVSQHHKQQKHVNTVAALRKSDAVVEGQDSLMTLVDRAEGGENRLPSRRYGSNVDDDGPIKVAKDSDAQAGIVTPRSTSTASGIDGLTGLSKRKSVRLVDDPIDADANGNGTASTGNEHHRLSPPRSMSPSLSVKSDSRSATPSKGILVNVQPPSPAQALANSDSPSSKRSASGGWDSRRNGSKDQDDTTDEDSDAGEYQKMRKQFVKHSKGMQDVMSGTFTSEQKGKGKAVA
ncbi:hypothetical protein OIO90_000955 [Microbotryomycetes sp. JL221]|nr:hypothetical protein OIO90_000955 [Microbotryomycetes sp. JL221]